MTTNRGGVESFLFNYVSRLQGDIQFDFWCNNEYCAYENGLKDLGCKFFHGTAYGNNPVKAKSDMRDFFANHASEYDVLWCNASMLVHIDELKFAKKYGVQKRILHSHNSRNMFSGLNGRIKASLHFVNRIRANKLATDYWACSREAGEYFFAEENINSSHYRFIPNAIDTSQFAFNPALRLKKRSELGISDESHVIGFVGRLQYQKDPELLMRIFVEYHKKDAKSILLVIGDGELKAQCKAIIAASQLEQSVLFLGNRTDVNELYQAMDVFCLTSRFEGFGIVCIEAQCAGLPCIVSESLPSDIVLTNLISKVNHESSVERWSELIVQASNSGVKRDRRNKEIDSRGFDINSAASQIKHLFQC
ncbi:glycosyltransferase [Bifidobacterium aquikefiri]|nr:glycosyltransferase [Bifidobacterium aquikefiri]